MRDLGTETALLVITRAKVLHDNVLASDIDPPSVRVARDSAKLDASGVWNG
jgi:ribosomal protein L11 methyltransferase